MTIKRRNRKKIFPDRIQVFTKPEQKQKLILIAKYRGCNFSDVLRELIDSLELPESESQLTQKNEKPLNAA